MNQLLGEIYSRTLSIFSALKINESRYIAVFMVSGPIKKLFSINCVNIYFSQSVVFANIYLFPIFFQ